jgi:hypothetical protein
MITIKQLKTIQKLYSNVISTIGDVAYDAQGNQVEIDMDLVDAWQDPNQYKYDRVNEYPSIGDQLDALFHAGVFPEEMAEKIQAVKNKYPKS